MSSQNGLHKTGGILSLLCIKTHRWLHLKWSPSSLPQRRSRFWPGFCFCLQLTPLTFPCTLGSIQAAFLFFSITMKRQAFLVHAVNACGRPGLKYFSKLCTPSTRGWHTVLPYSIKSTPAPPLLPCPRLLPFFVLPPVMQCLGHTAYFIQGGLKLTILKFGADFKKTDYLPIIYP